MGRSIKFDLIRATGRVLASIFLIILMTMSEIAVAGALSYARHQSRLQVTLPPAVTSWQVEDRAGHVCARGTGPGTIVLDKVASDTDLVLRADGVTTLIPAARQPSPFPKLDHGARIYQLPV